MHEDPPPAPLVVVFLSMCELPGLYVFWPLPLLMGSGMYLAIVLLHTADVSEPVDVLDASMTYVSSLAEWYEPLFYCRVSYYSHG